MGRMFALGGILLWAVAGCDDAAPYHLPDRVVAAAETDPVPSYDDAADDPAIWVHPETPAESLIIGTDKGSGLLVFDLNGKQVQYLELGKLNNVDLRQRPWKEQGLTLLAATQRNPSRLVLLTLDHGSRSVKAVATHETELDEPYGICLYQDADGNPYVIANSKDGQFLQYEVTRAFDLEPRRRWQLATQPEGCVADDETGELFLGEEAAGVWVLSADPQLPVELAVFDTVGKGALVADVEGLTLYREPSRTLLIVSSQGDNSFAVYNARQRQHLASFHVHGDGRIDGVTETDGIAATAIALPGYPEGLLVVQDGDNQLPAARQNFKLVDWRDVQAFGF